MTTARADSTLPAPETATEIAWDRSAGVESLRRYPAAPSAIAAFTYSGLS